MTFTSSTRSKLSLEAARKVAARATATLVARSAARGARLGLRAPRASAQVRERERARGRRVEDRPRTNLERGRDADELAGREHLPPPVRVHPLARDHHERLLAAVRRGDAAAEAARVPKLGARLALEHEQRVRVRG